MMERMPRLPTLERADASGAARRSPRPTALLPLVLLLGFAASLALRVAVGGDDAARSIPAGLAFAACLAALAWAAGTGFTSSRDGWAAGMAGGVLLCLPATVEVLVTGGELRSSEGFPVWAAAVTIVVIAEEMFLRGALHDSLVRWGPVLQVGVGATVFALLHVPLYGWHVVPLDLAVGVVLGGLRLFTGTLVAPITAHAMADYVGWFLSG